MEGKLTRSRSDRMIAGVLGGLAAHFGWSPQKVRIGFVLLSILSTGFPGILPEERREPRGFEMHSPGSGL